MASILWNRRAPLTLSAGILLTACSGGNGSPPRVEQTRIQPEPAAPPPPSKVTAVMTGVRWESRINLSAAATQVLKAAFDRDYEPGEGLANAYDFALHGGNKGMDWWPFPWDLPSSRPE